MTQSQTTGIPVLYNGKTFFRCRRCRNFQLVTQDELEDGVCAFCSLEEAETHD